MTNNNQHFIEKVNVIQINLHNCMTASSTLAQHMLENSIDLALIQEPYLVDNRIALFPINFQKIHSNIKPKAAILINPMKVKAMILEKHSNDLIVWAIINFGNKNIHFCSIYLPPSKPIEEAIDKLNQDLFEIKPQYLVIGGDTNAKSSVWFSSTNDRRGDRIIEFVVQNITWRHI